MKIALAQISPVVGDVDGNAAKVIDAVRRAKAGGADVVVTPELAILGYPPLDLVLRRELVEKNVEALQRIAAQCVGIVGFVGYAQPDPQRRGKGVFNSAAVCRNGAVESSYAKMLLPIYDVFDDARYFTSGSEVQTAAIGPSDRPRRVAVSICEDLWNNRQFNGRRVYASDPIAAGAATGVDLLINLSASPFRAGIEQVRLELFGGQVRSHGLPLVYVNQVCGNDDLVFDGASCVFAADGQLLARARAFAKDLLIVDLDAPRAARIEPYPDRLDSIHAALVLGIRDYVRKCGFQDVVLGLSGGIDSALTAALAIEALGANHVHGFALPSRFSSSQSLDDARQLAGNFGIGFHVIEIDRAHGAFEHLLAPHFADRAPGVAEENVQARIRGNLLMALSNKFHWLLLNTGNKSELAVGYCTLYGDMCGGLAVLGDVLKTTVYALSKLVNSSAGREIIPARTIARAPTAELRPDQTDQDTLPPYDTLDAILEQYLEQGRTVGEIVAGGQDDQIVQRVVSMISAAEHKRKQAPIVLRVSPRAFGTGWRMPIAAGS